MGEGGEGMKGGCFRVVFHFITSPNYHYYQVVRMRGGEPSRADELVLAEELSPADELFPAEERFTADELFPAEELHPADERFPADELFPVDPVLDSEGVVGLALKVLFFFSLSLSSV